MNDFKQQFSNFTSEYLLKLRARGDELSDKAHQAIEEIFAERGELLPEKPKTPIITSYNEIPSTGNAGKKLKTPVIVTLGLIGMAIASVIANTRIGILISVGMIIYWIAKWVQRVTLTPAQREQEDIEKKAREDGLTEIMLCAADANLERIRELVEYGGDVNARSNTGTTALMYAAGNNHLAIVKFLLAAGANPKLMSDKKSTAAEIARKFGHLEIAEYLEQER